MACLAFGNRLGLRTVTRSEHMVCAAIENCMMDSHMPDQQLSTGKWWQKASGTN